MPNKARLYIDSTITVGILVLATAALAWRPADLARYASYFALGLVASTFKVRLARIRGTISGGFLFVLIAIAEFSFSETIFMACSTGLVQCFWKVKRRQARRQLLFNLATLGNGAALAYALPRLILNAVGYQSIAVILLIAATLYFWTNNISVLTALALVEDKPIGKIWEQCSLWSYCYFLAQAALAGFISVCIHARGWVFSLLLIVLSFVVYLSFKRIANFFLAGKAPIRKAKRYDAIDCTAEAIWRDRHGNEHNTAVRILDVSELGMRVESPEPFGTATIHIVVPAHGIDARGEVCYCEFTSGKYTAGIELHLVLTQRQLMSLLYTRGSSDLTERG